MCLHSKTLSIVIAHGLEEFTQTASSWVRRKQEAYIRDCFMWMTKSECTGYNQRQMNFVTIDFTNIMKVLYNSYIEKHTHFQMARWAVPIFKSF